MSTPTLDEWVHKAGFARLREEIFCHAQEMLSDREADELVRLTMISLRQRIESAPKGTVPELATAIAKIEARADAATPGPWEHYETYIVSGPKNVSVCDISDANSDGDIRFIAHARTDVPTLAHALGIATDWMASNIPVMECREDEDCDHCNGRQALEEILRVLAGDGEGRP